MNFAQKPEQPSPKPRAGEEPPAESGARGWVSLVLPAVAEKGDEVGVDLADGTTRIRRAGTETWEPFA